jgi:glutathione S-transferase
MGENSEWAMVRFWVAISDIALYAYAHVAPEGGFDLDPYLAVRGWLKRVAAQLGITPITA